MACTYSKKFFQLLGVQALESSWNNIWSLQTPLYMTSPIWKILPSSSVFLKGWHRPKRLDMNLQMCVSRPCNPLSSRRFVVAMSLGWLGHSPDRDLCLLKWLRTRGIALWTSLGRIWRSSSSIGRLHKIEHLSQVCKVILISLDLDDYVIIL